ncbi:MAG: hypothetical protein KY447_09800 [Actinobacteria bacterium]|nr:hypothetical protein [Actinomycetota bacterium]
MNVRRAARVATVATAVLLGWASVALGCTAQPQVSYSLLPESAAPGSSVTVRGAAVNTKLPVEIRWNGVNGALLAAATPVNGTLSVPVQVPDVPPGIYSLVLVTGDAGVARTSFEVTGRAAPAPQATAQVWPSIGNIDPVGAPDSLAPRSLGVALLAVGLVGLFTGSTVAVTHRRRAVVHTER